MIPIRVILVEDALPLQRRIRDEMEASGSFEVYAVSSSAAGMLNLARMQPDLAVIYPYAGRGAPEEWRRAVGRYRQGRALGLLVLLDLASAEETETLADMADLGMIERPPAPGEIRSLLMNWAGQEEILDQAG